MTTRIVFMIGLMLENFFHDFFKHGKPPLHFQYIRINNKWVSIFKVYGFRFIKYYYLRIIKNGE